MTSFYTKGFIANVQEHLEYQNSHKSEDRPTNANQAYAEHEKMIAKKNCNNTS